MKDICIPNTVSLETRPQPSLSVDVDSVSAEGVTFKQVSLAELRALISAKEISDIVPAVFNSEQN